MLTRPARAQETKVEIAALRKREMALSHRLLQAMRALEVAQARGAPLRNEEVEFRKQLLRMRAELAKPTQFQAKLNELASMARMQGDRAGDAVAQLDRVALVRVREVLDLQQSELEQLTRVLKKDAEDVAVVQQGQADAAPRG
jgi:selenocysteine lyase/cysteine desulfurase